MKRKSLFKLLLFLKFRKILKILLFYERREKIIKNIRFHKKNLYLKLSENKRLSLNNKMLNESNKELREINFDYYSKIKFLSTDVSKLDKNKLMKWSKEVRKIGKCDICGETENLTAHHLWSKILFPKLAYQFDNGVCLCDSCHKAFHRKYSDFQQITPKKYSDFKLVLQNEINLYGKINYSNY